MQRKPCPELQTRLVAVGLSVLCGVLLLVGPVRAHVAGKTYDLWIATTPGQPPAHTCARFTATTLHVDACGPDPGGFQESVVVNEPPNFLTLWNAVIPCNGTNVAFIGTSTDGGVLGQANVMAATSLGQLVLSVAGVENPACQ